MTRLLLSFALFAAFGSGCANQYPACPTECSEASPELARIAGRAFLVSSLTFPEAVGDPRTRTAVGLDLDGVDSGRGSDAIDARCDEFAEDHASDLGPTFGGVDNAGQSLIGTAQGLVEGETFDGSLHDAIAEGRIRWALRIDELPEDATPSGLGMELWAIDEAVATDADGVPVPGQALRGHRVARVEGFTHGSVAWGYVTDEVGVEVEGGDVFFLPFDDFRLGGWAAEAQPSSEVLRGTVAGSFSVDALVDRSVRLSPIFSSNDYRFVIGLMADLQPSAADPQLCERISVGLAFEAVPVSLLP